MSRRAFAVAIVVAVLEAAAATWLIFTSDSETNKVATVAVAVTAGVLFIASGLIAIRRRPENRTGLYLAAVGYLWLLNALPEANNDAVFTVGILLGNLAFIPFALLVLAFPTGRLTTRIDRVLVQWTVWFVILGPLLMELVSRKPPGCSENRCRDSAILVYDSHFLGSLVDWVATLMTLALILCVVVVLVRRWRRATPALRRILRRSTSPGSPRCWRCS